MATQERVEMRLTLDNAGEVYNYYSTGFAARGRTARMKLGIIRGMRMLALGRMAWLDIPHFLRHQIDETPINKGRD